MCLGVLGAWKYFCIWDVKKGFLDFLLSFQLGKELALFLSPLLPSSKLLLFLLFLRSLIFPSSVFQLTFLPSASWNRGSVTFHPSLSLSSYSALLLGHLSVCFNIECGRCQLLSVELAKEHLGVGAGKKLTVALGESQGWNSCLGVLVAWKVV